MTEYLVRAVNRRDSKCDTVVSELYTTSITRLKRFAKEWGPKAQVVLLEVVPDGIRSFVVPVYEWPTA